MIILASNFVIVFKKLHNIMRHNIMGKTSIEGKSTFDFFNVDTGASENLWRFETPRKI